MNESQRMVREFHQTFDCLISETPTIPDFRTQNMRCNLIEEELDELKRAFMDGSLIQVADALADILYVTYGAAVSCGIDIEPVFKEVHRSNMSKVGGHKREDGKWIKPDTYSPADLMPIIEKQRSEACGT